MIRPFGSARLKLDRAEHHLKTLKTKIGLFSKDDAYPVRYQFNADRTECRFYVSITKPLPQDEWGPIIGDCAHNARAALDHVTWELAGSDPTDDETQFPIYDAPHATMSFVQRAQRRIGRLPSSAQTLIEQLQPYIGGNPKRHPLWVCRRLDDIDKHRVIPVVAAAIQSPGVSVSSGRLPITKVEFEEGPFVDGAQIGLMSFYRPVGPDVQMNSYFTFVETISDGPPYLDSWRTLDRVIYHIRRVIDVIEHAPDPAALAFLPILQDALA
jgi:hypothetical protein